MFDGAAIIIPLSIMARRVDRFWSFCFSYVDLLEFKILVEDSTLFSGKRRIKIWEQIVLC